MGTDVWVVSYHQCEGYTSCCGDTVVPERDVFERGSADGSTEGFESGRSELTVVETEREQTWIWSGG